MKKYYIGDVLTLLLAVLVAIGALVPWFGGAGQVAVVEQEGKMLYRLPLDQGKKVEITGKYTNQIEVENGKIRFAHSDCPSQTCVRTGWIGTQGQSAVCTANGVVVRVLGHEIDTVVG